MFSSWYNDDESPRQIRKSEFLFTSEFANLRLDEGDAERQVSSESKFECLKLDQKWSYEIATPWILFPGSNCSACMEENKSD